MTLAIPPLRLQVDRPVGGGGTFAEATRGLTKSIPMLILRLSSPQANGIHSIGGLDEG